MKFKDLDTRKLKKVFGATTVKQSYHNKHKDGSGNFGIIMIIAPAGVADRQCWELDGTYDSTKTLHSLRFGTCYQPGSQLNLDEDIISQIKERMKAIASIPW